MVVHYCGHPADMDPIMDIARRHKLKVIEDASHAHGALYKGRMVGTLGDVAGCSMMSAKGFPIGEGGMLSTNDRTIFERAIAFGHYERCKTDLTDPALQALVGLPSPLPAGAIKGRINQTCSAMGRVQLKHFPERMAEVQRALNRFWDLLEGVPGLRAHRVAKSSGSTMGGWYNPLAHYIREELGGLPVEKFHQALLAEGGRSGGGANVPIHLHPLVNQSDIYHDGKPTRLAFADRDVRQAKGTLPVTERLAARSLGVPSFKHDDAEQIALYASAYRKVAMNARHLL
jgi:dTDP-4-amino-4,6-dideoxygalactose transaminase